MYHRGIHFQVALVRREGVVVARVHGCGDVLEVDEVEEVLVRVPRVFFRVVLRLRVVGELSVGSITTSTTSATINKLDKFIARMRSPLAYRV